jgi:hypothetical protein
LVSLLWLLREEIPVLLNGGGRLQLGFLKAKERALIVWSSLGLGVFGSREIGVFFMELGPAFLPQRMVSKMRCGCGFFAGAKNMRSLFYPG